MARAPSPRVPTLSDYHCFDGAHARQTWHQAGPTWSCPACRRTRFETLRWSTRNQNEPPEKQYESWFSSILRYEPLASAGVAPRFAPTLICDQCKGSASTAKARLKLPSHFFFAPQEIGAFVISKPHHPHKIDFKAAHKVYSQSCRPPAGRPAVRQVPLDLPSEGVAVPRVESMQRQAPEAPPPGSRLIIERLAKGQDPATGAGLPADTVLHRPEVIRALYAAAAALHGSEQPSAAQAPQPREAKASQPPLPAPPEPLNRPLRRIMVPKPWTSSQDEQLVASFRSGVSAQRLAAASGRTLSAIASRLKQLGVVDDRTEALIHDPSRPLF